MLITIITFIIILSALVFVHELGHFWTARKAGVKVDEFGIGIPPRIIGIRKTNTPGKKWELVSAKEEAEKTTHTIYSLNWLPIGGFVKIKGENGEDEGPDSFVSKSAGKRSFILSAGVIMNVLFTIVLLSAVFLIGFPTTINENSDLSRIRDPHLQIVSVIESSPAHEAGMQPGETIRAIDNTPITTVDEIQKYISDHKSQTINVTLEHEGQERTLTVTPYQIPDQQIYGFGIGLVEVGTIRFPLHIAVWKGIQGTYNLTAEIFRVLGQIFADLYAHGKVEQQLAGPVGIAVLTGEVVDLGFVHVLQFAALLSINLAIINILPFPALDGGRILFVIIEKFRGRAVSRKIENVIHTVGFFILIGLIILVTISDISHFGGQILGAVQRVF